ncbi:L-tyrosine/L-tryptophan isonitrile synthase family protein [Chitinivorax sp. B]|uniref:L-tyrosine/L-tryptophan isonitrile synthase family protein n=1 Tax=Chitinivorax sp. B TaxID=2502235 RepID=UPI0010F87E4F|nr:L-tyrosine/L-tryptophan isonitrile synthase family protein [Chitinivorax sp. B]
MNMQDLRLVEHIVALLNQYRVPAEQDRFETIGRTLLTDQVVGFVNRSAPLLFILPGFPCKSPNKTAKSFGTLPDLGEALAIQYLDAMCAQIKRLYPPGIELTILSDGTTFADLVDVSEADKNAYRARLRDLAVTEFIRWADLGDLLEQTLPDADMVKLLTRQANGKPGSLARFKDEVAANETLSATHDKLCGYLYNDVRVARLNEGNQDAFMAQLAENAYAMMFRGRALSAHIERRYPQHIRLSVHQYDNSGPKFTVSLFKGATRVMLPWHSVPQRDLNGGFRLLPHAQINRELCVQATYQGQPWCYLQVDDPLLTQFSYRIIKAPRFGLEIINTTQLSLAMFNVTFLTGLAQDFGFVLFRNARFDDAAALITLSERFTGIDQRQIGEAVKAQDKLNGLTQATRQVPSADVAGHPSLTARQIFLYCKAPLATDAGQTALVDSHTVLRLAGEATTTQWRDIALTYDTGLTHADGSSLTHPLIQTHPNTGELILRYQKTSKSAFQKFTVTAQGLDQVGTDMLIDKLNTLCHDPRCRLVHEWQANDLLLIDNLCTLHDQLPLPEQSDMQTFWRVQIP